MKTRWYKTIANIKGRLRDRGENGFAMVMVVMAITLLSIIGALSILVAASSLKGVVNMKPEDRAFQIAEAGLAVSHTYIVNNQIASSPFSFSASDQGGNYSVTITGAAPNWRVVSTSSYISEGVTYQRKIQEDVTYYGDQAFDAMRNYLLFAGHNLDISVGSIFSLLSGIEINYNVRAQNQTNISYTPVISLLNGMTINGRVEGQNSIDIYNQCVFLGVSNLILNGDVLTNGTATLRTAGWLLGLAFTTVLQDIAAGTIVMQPSFGDVIVNGTQQQGWHDLPPVYVPKPNMAYYKALALEQGNYYAGNQTFTNKKISDFHLSASSSTVIYVAGDLNLNGFVFDQPVMRGVFVCEGNFAASSLLDFIVASAKFQVISKGNATFNNRWHFADLSSRQLFIWSGNDVTLDMGLLSVLNWQVTALQVTALHDISLSSNNIIDGANMVKVNYNPPDVDLGGFPIDVTVSNWKELPIP